MTQRILLVEDDLALRTGLLDSLALEGYEVTAAADGEQARKLVFSRHFDLILLDLMLPKRSGLEVLRELREQEYTTPVLILTAKGDEADKVLGLERGADDYVTKPFSLRELCARVRAMLRRQDRGRRVAGQHALVALDGGTIRIDLAGFELERNGMRRSLSRKEAGILRLLVDAGGRVVSRERFLETIWGTSQFVGSRTIDTHILNLRKKIEPDPAKPRWLVTVHGVGYRLLRDDDER